MASGQVLGEGWCGYALWAAPRRPPLPPSIVFAFCPPSHTQTTSALRFPVVTQVADAAAGLSRQAEYPRSETAA